MTTGPSGIDFEGMARDVLLRISIAETETREMEDLISVLHTIYKKAREKAIADTRRETEMICWLVERKEVGQTLYLTGNGYGEETMTPDPHKAIRFCRKQDAEMFVSGGAFGDRYVAEHIFAMQAENSPNTGGGEEDTWETEARRAEQDVIDAYEDAQDGR